MEYKVGDKVKILSGDYKGKTGTILAFDESIYNVGVNISSYASIAWHKEDELELIEDEPDALKTQVSGNHYKNMEIQPAEFCYANKIGFIEGSVIKYICRYQDKNGVEDLKKAKHFIDILIELYETNINRGKRN